MNLAGLIALYRLESGDDASPPFVADTSLMELANEAQEEACRRADLLKDSTTTAICTVAVTAGTPTITLDARIIDVKRVKMASETVPLAPAMLDEMDEASPGWDTQTGKPRAYIPDYQSGAIRLWPNPTANESLALTVTRLPLADMNDLLDAPEIRASYHRALVQWMLYRVYSIQDAELYDAQKADKCLANFEREFGKRQSARNEQWRRERHNLTAAPIA